MQFFCISDIGKRVKLPFILCPLKAGFPSPADDFLDREIDLNEHLIKDKEATVLARISGDSMMPTLMDGDTIVVDKSISPSHNDVVVAVVDGEFTVKRLLKNGRKVELHPDNPKYEPIDLEEGIGFWCWGVVTYVIRKP